MSAGASVVFWPFGSSRLEDQLSLKPPPLVQPGDAFRQLRYIHSYVSSLGCKSIAIEQHYIDRDHMEDHSVFYSKNLHWYENYCRRVHFFSEPPDTVEKHLTGIVAIGVASGRTAYSDACRKFSSAAYLGFCVIKPLRGSPVGRTVVRHLEEGSLNLDGWMRSFKCCRNYRVHFAGTELFVEGLSFQQQDVAVSACATTAIWAALQKAQDHEAIASATPAQITLIAGKYSLPFGRAMPSEGLSVDQMCQVVHSSGVSPILLKIDDFKTARSYLHAATKSGIATIVIMKHEQFGSHAITVTGMSSLPKHKPEEVARDIEDISSDLRAVYCHDDRLGPYLRADFVANDRGKPHLVIQAGVGEGPKEQWAITHLLIPMHSKIRLSFAGLYELALRTIAQIQTLRTKYLEPAAPNAIKNPAISFETLILRAPAYIESVMFESPTLSASQLDSLTKGLRMPRYLGIVRLRAEFFGTIDVLLDTTSTKKNIHCLGVVGFGSKQIYSDMVMRLLVHLFDGCRSVGF